MGQKNAIATFLLGGGMVLPFLLSVFSALLGPLAVPVALTLVAVGFGMLVYAKWPTMASGHWFTLGPRNLEPRRRFLYWAAYLLIGIGLFLCIAAPPFW